MDTVRIETPDDSNAVREVVTAAFTASAWGHQGEADLVDQLRRNCDDFVSLVATDGSVVIGHICFSPVSIRTSSGEVWGMGLGPMAVVPAHQRSGVGKALIESGLQRLAARGCAFVVVLGHPEYYPRFGFVPAASMGIRHGFAGIEQEVLFINLMDAMAGQSTKNGIVRYRPEFGPQQG